MYPYIYKRISDRYIFILILLTCLGSQAPDPGFAVSAVCAPLPPPLAPLFVVSGADPNTSRVGRRLPPPSCSFCASR